MSVAVPNVVDPETKVTEPVGLMPVTVAVSVICALGFPLLVEAWIVVVLGNSEGAVGAGFV